MAAMKKIQTTLLFLALTLSIVPTSFAESFQTQEASIPLTTFISRGQAVHEVVDTFDLKQKNAKFIGDCLQHLDECFFVFTTMSRYDQMSLDPMRLYPDVPEAYMYSNDINVATMLGLVHGNIEVKGSPFHPRAYLSRIHALKVVLGAAGLMDWREKFELVRDLGDEDTLRNEKSSFADVNALRDDSWWYPRYVNFALDDGIIDAGEYFRPDEPITVGEYRDMLQRALVKSQQLNGQTGSKNQPSGNSSQQTVN